jgi:hypothetical protein
MKRPKPYQLIIILCTITLLSSCSFEKLGQNLGKGVSTQTDTIGTTLIQGVTDELTNPVTRAKISRFLDSIVTPLTDTLALKILLLRDSLIDKKILIWADSLLEALTGNQLKLNMEKVQAALIGKTKKDVFEMKNEFSSLLDEILSTKTKNKLGSFRDELLGDKTNQAITRIADTLVTHIVDSAIAKLSYGYNKDINPQLKGDISFVSKYASYLLLLVGGIAAVIIFLVWRSREKYLQLSTLLTKHINQIPDQKIYNSVTSKIKDDAMTAGVESWLRDLLNKNGMLGEDPWKTQFQKMSNT